MASGGERPGSRTALVRLETAVIALLLVVAACISTYRGVRGKFDFQHFYLDAVYLWRHGELIPALRADNPADARQLPFYLPTVPVMISPIALAASSADATEPALFGYPRGRVVGAVIWAVAQTLALAFCVLRLREWCRAGREDGHGRLTLLLLLAISGPAFYEAIKFNQVSFFTLALLLAGIGALERGRDLRAGAWLAAAAVLKILPAIFLVWLVLKRRWAAVLGFCVAATILLAVPPFLALGPQKSVEYHKQWWSYNASEGGPRRWMMEVESSPNTDHFVDRRNQSIPALTGRLLWGGHPQKAAWQPMALSLDAALRVATLVTLGLGLALLFATRSRLAQPTDDPWRWRGEFALYAIAIQALAPLTRMYYLVWTMPALAVLVYFATPAAGNSRTAGWARAGVALWLAGMALWPVRISREYGVHLAMLIGIGVVLVVMFRSPTCWPRPQR